MDRRTLSGDQAFLTDTFKDVPREGLTHLVIEDPSDPSDLLPNSQILFNVANHLRLPNGAFPHFTSS